MPESLNLAEQLKRANHKICALILYSDLEWIDIQMEIETMRELCLAEAPDKEELFEAIYLSRYHRLWEQWHWDRPEPPEASWRPKPWTPES